MTPQMDQDLRTALTERLNRLAKDGWNGSVEKWCEQAIFAMSAAARELAAPPRPVDAERVETDALVDRLAVALKAKLRASEEKYEWGNGWLNTDWSEACQRDLARHVTKGDPLDVAAYAAFCWHHGWSTSPAHSPDKAVTREGLKTRMEAALDGKTKWSRDCHLSGEYLCSLVWPMVEEALANKPTGTEAGRGALTEALTAIEFALEIDDHYDMREFLKGWSEGDTSEWPEFSVALTNATPTPPVSLTPDSTGPAGATWWPMKGAPADGKTQIVARHKPNDQTPHGWIATIIIDPDDEDRRSGRDTIVHYNGERLLSGFHGMWTGWMYPEEFAALTPSAPIAAPVRDDFDSQNPLHWAEIYHAEFCKRMIAEAELRAFQLNYASDVPGDAQTQEGGR